MQYFNYCYLVTGRLAVLEMWFRNSVAILDRFHFAYFVWLLKDSTVHTNICSYCMYFMSLHRCTYVVI